MSNSAPQKPAGVAEWIASTVACHPLLAWWMSGRRACCIHVYTVYTPIVEKAGVAPDVTLGFTACKQVSVQVREPPWLWNPWGGSHEVQNQWLHKMDLGPTKIFKKKPKNSAPQAGTTFSWRISETGFTNNLQQQGILFSALLNFAQNYFWAVKKALLNSALQLRVYSHWASPFVNAIVSVDVCYCLTPSVRLYPLRVHSNAFLLSSDMWLISTQSNLCAAMKWRWSNLGQVILHMATCWVDPMHIDGARDCGFFPDCYKITFFINGEGPYLLSNA